MREYAIECAILKVQELQKLCAGRQTSIQITWWYGLLHGNQVEMAYRDARITKFTRH